MSPAINDTHGGFALTMLAKVDAANGRGPPDPYGPGRPAGWAGPRAHFPGPCAGTGRAAAARPGGGKPARAAPRVPARRPAVGRRARPPGVTPLQGVFMEAFATSLLVFTVLGSTNDQRRDVTLPALPIGLAVGCALLTAVSSMFYLLRY